MIRRTVEDMRARLLRQALAWFASLQARRPAFAGHATLADLIAFLSTSGKATFAERENLLWDLVEEYQASGDDFPLLLLYVAYGPLLLRIRRRLVATRTPQDELDQIVIMAFMMVIKRPSTKRCPMMPLHLRQRTERLVFAMVKRDSLPELPGDTDDIGAESSHIASEEICSTEDLAILSFLASFDPRTSELVDNALLQVEAEEAEEDEAEQEDEASYQRLKKRRTRATRALKAQEAILGGPQQLFLIPRSWQSLGGRVEKRPLADPRRQQEDPASPPRQLCLIPDLWM